MAGSPQVVGTAMLRDYPLRLWARQQEHTEEVLREFSLLLLGQESADAASAPAQLVALAQMFTTNFGTLMDEIAAKRLAALEAGQDRVDSEVPLVEGTPELMDQVRRVLDAVDEYCRRGDLLALARPPELVALFDWSTSELTAQYNGAQPTPWPGPF